jgi:AAA-like domain/CHAT domain
MKTILVLAANPTTVQLQLDEEVRNIRAALERSKGRDGFKLETRSAVRWKDVRRAIEDLHPEVVHFSGHGTGEEGLLLEDDELGGVRYVSADALRRMFELFPCVECVVLNACYSEVQARAIYRHVSCVVGMSLSVGDRAARDFAEAFYDGVGAGRVYGEAFQLGLSGMANDVEAWTPMLLWRKTEKPTQAIKLEEPGAKLGSYSSFYVLRPLKEEDAFREVMQPGALIRIKAPPEFGKSSLMGRVVDFAKTKQAQTVAINFREIDREFLGSLNSFLRYFCLRITRALKIENRIADYWESGLGSKGDCKEYFEDHLLPQISEALVLELDEVDLLFDRQFVNDPWVIDFFGMIRAWHDNGKDHPQWRKLRFVLVHSKDVDRETLHQSQSPFNVGTEIVLGEFSEAQVVDLAGRHGVGKNEAIELRKFVGGHPQLIRLGLYSIARQELSLEELVADGATEAGLYGTHLRRLRSSVERDVSVLTAFRRVLASGDGCAIDLGASSVLRSLGVVTAHRNEVAVTCDLYRQYFRSVWS